MLIEKMVEKGKSKKNYENKWERKKNIDFELYWPEFE